MDDNDYIGTRNNIIYYICTGFSILIIFITAFLIIVYSKTKALHSYPCYFNIILCLVIEIDNILRIIPFYDNPNNYDEKDTIRLVKIGDSYGCFFQGYALAFFDRIMLTTMTMYSAISFLGLVTFDFYKKYEKKIFIFLIIISFLIPLIMIIAFIQNIVEQNDDVCEMTFYEENEELIIIKFIFDLVFTCILFFINLYSLLHLLIYICKLINKYKEKNQIQRVENFYFHFWKFVANLILTIITFTFVIIIKLDLEEIKWSDETLSLIYVILSLFIVLFYTLNLRVLKEGKNILCCRNEETSEDNNNEEDEEIEISNLKSQRKLVESQ